MNKIHDSIILIYEKTSQKLVENSVSESWYKLMNLDIISKSTEKVF